MNALPLDPALPHLATALDSQAMGEVFGSLLASEGGAVTLEGCRVDRVKYRPRRNCSVSYRLLLRDARGRAFDQAVGTRWCAGSDAARRHAKALARPHRPSRAGPSLSEVAALGMVAAWLPNDPKLDALATLLDDEALRACWLPEVAQALWPGSRPVAHRTTLVQWMPEHRACARVELQLARGAHTRSHALYVKTDAARGGDVTHAVMQTMNGLGRVRIAEPVLWQPAAGLHWQCAVDGQPLAEQGRPISATVSTRVGEIMARLHATLVPLPASRVLTPDLLRQQRDDAVRALDAVALSARFEPLLRALDDSAHALRHPSTLHGDLHRGNLLRCADGGLALIDLDSVRHGPAALELGGWIAEALALALLAGLPPATAAPQWRAMLRGYAEGHGTVPDEQELAWATAHQLVVQRAYRCVANLKPGRLAIVPALMECAELIARACSVDAVEALP